MKTALSSADIAPAPTERP